MAEEHQQKSHEYEAPPFPERRDAEVKDRGLFDFLSKKEDHQKHDQEEVMAAEFEDKVQVSEVDYEAKIEEDKKEEKPSLLEKLRRSDSSSSSSSDEEEEKDGEKKKKKKKGLKQKISGEEIEEKKHEEDTTIFVEKVEEVHVPVYTEPPHHTPEPIYVAEPVQVVEPPPVHPEEKKGFLEKIKEKLPGHKKAEEVPAAASPPRTPAAVAECPPPPVVETPNYEEPKEKKGIFDKIKEKLPGYHSKTEEDKEKGSSD